MGRPGTGGDDAPWSADDERLAALVDREHVDHPAYGARKIAHVLRESGEPRATRWRVTRLMGLMGIRPYYPLLAPGDFSHKGLRCAGRWARAVQAQARGKARGSCARQASTRHNPNKDSFYCSPRPNANGSLISRLWHKARGTAGLGRAGVAMPAGCQTAGSWLPAERSQEATEGAPALLVPREDAGVLEDRGEDEAHLAA